MNNTHAAKIAISSRFSSTRRCTREKTNEYTYRYIVHQSPLYALKTYWAFCSCRRLNIFNIYDLSEFSIRISSNVTVTSLYNLKSTYLQCIIHWEQREAAPYTRKLLSAASCMLRDAFSTKRLMAVGGLSTVRRETKLNQNNAVSSRWQ